MKRLWGLAAAALLLTGCTPERPPLDPPVTETGEAAPDFTDSTVTTGNAVIPAETTAPSESADVRELYQKTLQDLHDDLILPSGTELKLEGEIEENRFAVWDIDGDGREELLLEITQADINDAFTAVYDVDADGDLRREVRYAAKLSFWSDGIVLAEYPDAAESEGDFIPYAVSQYDPEQDVYTEFAYVSAIDREKLAANDLLDEYPEDADTSGTGRVYCIRGDNPVDVTEYEEWYASWHDGLTEQAVPYQYLTADAIDALTNPDSAETTTETTSDVSEETTS